MSLFKKSNGKQDLERTSNTKALEMKPVSIAKQKAEVYLNSHWTDSVGKINIAFKLIFSLVKQTPQFKLLILLPYLLGGWK